MKLRSLYIPLLSVLTVAVLLSGCGKKAPAPQKILLKIDTDPQGADLYNKGKKIGLTPYSKKLKRPLHAVMIKVEKPGYETQWITLSVPTSGLTKLVKLKPITSDILVLSKPSEAQVVIDGTVMGETPLVLRNQPLGEKVLEVKKVGFVSQRKTYTVKDSRPQKIVADLNSNIGTLNITSIPSGAEVFIDEKYFGVTPLKKTVEQGKLHIVVKKEGYTTFDQYVITKRNDTVSRDIQLMKLPGSLKVSSTPKGAMVYINNDLKNQSTPCTIEKITPGKYTVKVVKGGFDPVTKPVVIRQGKQSMLHFALGINTGGIDLVVNPPGVTVYLDGKVKGQTEADEDGKFSKVFRLRNLSEGIHTIIVTHKRAKPDRKVVKIEVKKGKTSRPKPIHMWVANAELRLKNGRKWVGYLRRETDDKVFFEPLPGVCQGYDRSEIESLKPLQIDEE